MLRLMSCVRNWTGFACLKSITMNQFGPVVSKEERTKNREEKTSQCITLTSLLGSQVMCVFRKCVSAGISNVKTLYFLEEFTFEFSNCLSEIYSEFQ